jgi:hypothetical protein
VDRRPGRRLPRQHGHRPRAGGKRVVVLEFIHNRQTEKVALDRLLVDGQPQSLVGGFLNLLLMQLE